MQLMAVLGKTKEVRGRAVENAHNAKETADEAAQQCVITSLILETEHEYMCSPGKTYLGTSTDWMGSMPRSRVVSAEPNLLHVRQTLRSAGDFTGNSTHLVLLISSRTG